MDTDGEYKGIPDIFKEMVAHPDDKSMVAEADLIPIHKLDGALAYFHVRSCARFDWYARMQTYTDDRKEDKRRERTRRQRWADMAIGAIIALVIHLAWYYLKGWLKNG